MRRSKQGFTLLEIIIVIIIVGILASVALPKLFSNIEYSKAVEAQNIMGNIKRNVESCSMSTGSFALCSALTDYGYPDPYATNNFTYTLATSTSLAAQNATCAAGATSTLEVLASAANDGANNWIAMDIYLDANGSICGSEMVGNGNYSKINNVNNG